jgi:protein-tyrosine phosphatase
VRIVRFPDGTKVRAAALRLEHDSWPEFGLYLDPAWRPSWQSVLVPWKDFGLPQSPEGAVNQICAAFKRAKAGQRVEVGCKEGLRRTGTVLACMAVLAGVPPDKAVSWVREHYHRRAVGTPDQKSWVHWFARQIGDSSDLAQGK